ncbi:MAG: PDZ domain-containing protein [Blastocatellia bacterium]
MFAKAIIIGFVVLSLTPLSLAQAPAPRRLNLSGVPPGIVYVSQRVDITRQLGENVSTLDGEPLPVEQTRNVTLGLVIDNQGFIISRLAGTTPENPPQDIYVTSPMGGMFPAAFVGMDMVTGICVLKLTEPVFKAPAFPATLPTQQSFTLYGFNPQLLQKAAPNHTMLRPRINPYSCTLVRATGDFRNSAQTPLYYLTKPELAAVQDGSPIAGGDGLFFGIAFYDISGEGRALVYPVTRLLNIARKVIESNASIAHGWLGATGRDLPANLETPMSRLVKKPKAKPEPGVLVMGVIPDSPAEIAGVQPRDLLLGISGQRIASLSQLGATLRQLPADSEVTLKIKRGEEYRMLPAKLSLAPATDPEKQLAFFRDRLRAMEGELGQLASNDPLRQKLAGKVETMRRVYDGIFSAAPPEVRLRAFYGMEIQLLTPQLQEFFGTKGHLLIESATPGGKAANAGLQAGDIITHVGETGVKDIAELIRELDETFGASEHAAITVTREQKPVTVKMQR